MAPLCNLILHPVNLHLVPVLQSVYPSVQIISFHQHLIHKIVQEVPVFLDLLVPDSLQVIDISTHLIYPISKIVESFLELPLALDDQGLLVPDLNAQSL